MSGQGAVADAHGGNFGKGRSQGREQLGFQLAVDAFSGKIPGDVGADLFIEHNGIADPVGIFTEAADGDIRIQTDILIHHPEGNRIGGAVLVAHELLQIKIVYPLIPGHVTAEGKAASKGPEGVGDPLPQRTGEDGRLGRGIVGILPGLGAEFGDPALVHDHHTLAVCHGDDTSVGDHIVGASGVGGAASPALPAPHHQQIFRDGIAIKIFLPLVRQDTAGGTECSFDKTHNTISFS